MTLTAFSLCRDVINLLRFCDTRIMTGSTIVAVNTTQVMVEGASKSRIAVVCDSCYRMACRAVIGIGSFNVANGLTLADSAVMTGQAVAGICTGVIKRYISKAGSYMASAAAIQQGIGRYVIWQFTDTYHIVVAGIASTHKRRASMIKSAGGKSPRSMANTAILGSRHVRGKRFTYRINTVTGIALFTYNIGAAMIDECANETLSVMAQATISGSVSMSLSIRCRFGVNASTSIVAGFTRLVRCIQQAVVENTAGHFEAHDTMAADAIDACYWMADRLTPRQTRPISNMAGITAEICNNGGSMVGVGIQKTGGIVAVVAFGVCRCMKFRFTYG